MMKSMMMRLAGLVARMGEKKNAYTILVRKPEGKRLLGRSRWENNTKMDIRERGWGVMDWINLAGDRDRWRTIVGKR
jgi:hypothetical protein